MNSVVLGADHAGFALKEHLKQILASTVQVIDVGTVDEQSVDYPDFALKVGEAILSGQASKGVLICGSGVGASVAANKVAGIRAGLCHDHYSAHQGVEHDNMNVLVLGSRVIGPALAEELVSAFLAAAYTHEERHERRLGKVHRLEENFQAARTAR